MKKIVIVSYILKKAAEKLSMPWVPMSKKNTIIDFHFEYLDSSSRDKVISDFENGKEITLPSDNPGEEVTIKKEDFTPQELSDIKSFMDRYKGKKYKAQGLYKYNQEEQRYERLL